MSGDNEEDYSTYPGFDMYDDQYYYAEDEYVPSELQQRIERFADPGGNSALHPATSNNPRIYPCPTCGTENVLTAKDKQSGYQCDRCADAAEGCF